MKEELKIRILTRASQYIQPEQLKKLRYILDEELIHYSLTPTSNELVPINNLGENIVQFLACKKNLEGLSPKTIKNYGYILRKFAQSIHKNVDQIDIVDLRIFLSGVTQGLKGNTKNSIINTLKSFFSWLLLNDKINKNYMLLIKPVKVEKNIRKPLSVSELEQIRFHCKTVREHAIVETFFSFGSRLDEIQKLDKADIDWYSGKVIVKGKGRKERMVILNDRAKLYLREYLKERDDNNEALFVGIRSPHDRLGHRAFQKIFNKLGKRTGLNRSLFPHLMRSSCGNELLRKGASIHDVQHYLGHSSPVTTDACYVSVNQESIRVTCEKILN